MKKSILLTMALLAGMMLAGCSKEDEEKFAIMVKEIQLTVGESQKIETSGGFAARSTDERVATVTADGTITAVSAGETDVVFTSTEDAAQQQTCHVTADWRYHYFDEPILDFSMNLAQIKENETHTWGYENWWDSSFNGFPEATDPFLVTFGYTNQEIPMLVYYGILDKEQGGIGMILLEMERAEIKKSALQLEERYGSPIEEDGRKIYSCKEKKFYISLQYGRITYSVKPF